jgi:protein-L-isoaspartate(D-aspartate) O-methyltransferase
VTGSSVDFLALLFVAVRCSFFALSIRSSSEDRLCIRDSRLIDRCYSLAMAWRCSGNSNQELLSNMLRADLIKSSIIFQAMSKVDRANYVPTSSRREAYTDAPQSIGYGATVSAPHMHAMAAEALQDYLRRGSKVLDVGSGSGYTLSMFWHLVKNEGQEGPDQKGQVVGIDHIPQLVKMADDNLRKDGLADALDRGCIEIVEGDGRLGKFRSTSIQILRC